MFLRALKVLLLCVINVTLLKDLSLSEVSGTVSVTWGVYYPDKTWPTENAGLLEFQLINI